VLTTRQGVSRLALLRGRGRLSLPFLSRQAGPLARIDYDDAEGELLLTAISGKARAWSHPALLGAFLRMPFLTAGVMLRIHWQALKLWLKGVPFFGKTVPQPLQESTK
jgi:DUF1365 family protein